MKKQSRNILAGIIIIIVLIVVAAQMGYLVDFGVQPFFRQTPSPTRPITDEDRANYLQGIGLFECSHTCYNSLAPSTALTHTTNYNVFWYTKRGVTWTYMGTGGTVASPVYVDMTPEDSAYLYAVVEIVAAQNYHVDKAKIVQTNSYVEQTLYTDFDGDTDDEFGFKIDMKGHSIPNDGYPAVPFHVHCYADDTSFDAVSSLDNLGNVGATKVTKWMEWDATFSAAAVAVPLTKIEFKVNVTDLTLVQLKQIEVPGRGFLAASNLVFDETASTIRWTYTYGITYDTAYYFTCPTGTKLTRDIDVKADFTLGTSNVTCTLTIWWLDPEAGTQSSDTDTCEATYQA